MFHARALIAKATNIFKTPHGFYLLVALVAGGLVAIITPPFMAADEPAHYIRVQELAHGIVSPGFAGKRITNPNDAQLYCNLDADIMKIALEHDIKGRTAEKYNLHLTTAGLKGEFACKTPIKEYTMANSSTNYGAFVYIPAIIGAFIANHINLSDVAALYMSRLFTIVTVVLLIFAAIKIMPRKKMLFAGLGLLPSVVFLSATISADSISLGVLFLFVAYVAKLYIEKDSITKNQWIILAVIALLLALTKTPYFIFVLLSLILVRRGNMWRIAAPVVISIGALIIAVFAMYLMSASTAGNATIPPNGVDPAKQVQVIEHKPLRFIRVLWNTYTTPYGDVATDGVIGVLGWGDVYLPTWLIFYFIIILALMALPESANGEKSAKKWKLSKLQYVLIGILLLANLVAANLAMYLYYSPVDYSIIYGIQGRYFLPSVVVGVLLICGFGLRFLTKDLERYNHVLKVLLCCGLAVTLFILFQRYYLYTP